MKRSRSKWNPNAFFFFALFVAISGGTTIQTALVLCYNKTYLHLSRFDIFIWRIHFTFVRFGEKKKNDLRVHFTRSDYTLELNFQLYENQFLLKIKLNLPMCVWKKTQEKTRTFPSNFSEIMKETKTKTFWSENKCIHHKKKTKNC